MHALEIYEISQCQLVGVDPKTVRRKRELDNPHSPGRKRELADGMIDDWKVSIRRAFRTLLFDSSSYRYKSRRVDQVLL